MTRSKPGQPADRGTLDDGSRAVVATIEFNAGDVALLGTALARTDAAFHSNHVVARDDRVRLLLGVRTADRSALEAALRSDPTVREATALVDLEPQCLYRVETADRVQPLHGMLVEANASVFALSGTDGRWRVRALFPSRDALGGACERCEDRGTGVTLRSVRGVGLEAETWFGLTDEQYAALTTAYEAGYFDVPREADLMDLADELGVSHQSLSERLRRAHKTLLARTLVSAPRWSMTIDGD